MSPQDFIKNKRILVTGGTGSIGSAIVRELLEYKPSVIKIFSRDPLKQSALENRFGNSPITSIIGDIRDEKRLATACEDADIVFHAAAFKYVPQGEFNPFEVIQTNLLGTHNILSVAQASPTVSHFVLISTDKAVQPINLYGSTKLCAEKLFISGNSYSPDKTFFSCVRYGNVIGSRGSVIPLFLKQKESGVITITDDRMTRFWITLDEAVELVIKAFYYMEGGEIFVPRIPSMRITDLARAIAPDCKVDIIGIRPGEKLHEALTGEDEGRNTISYKGMYVILPNMSWWESKNYQDGEKLPENFVYTSDTNDAWLGVDELHRIVYGEEETVSRKTRVKAVA